MVTAWVVSGILTVATFVHWIWVAPHVPLNGSVDPLRYAPSQRTLSASPTAQASVGSRDSVLSIDSEGLLAALGHSVLFGTGRRAIAARVTVALLVVVQPALGVGVLAWTVVRAMRSARRAKTARIRQVRAELSVLVDLLCVATRAGLSLRQAVVVTCGSHLAGAHRGELAVGLMHAVDGVSRGEPFIHALTMLGERPTIGPEVRVLTSAMVVSEQFGTPIAPALLALAEDVRDLRRRTAETEARRLPVRMLAPLVLLLLPSFALLTIAPLLAGGFTSLRHHTPESARTSVFVDQPR